MTQEQAMHKKVRQHLRKVVDLMIKLRANPITLPLTNDGYAVKVSITIPEDTGESVPELEPETVEE